MKKSIFTQAQLDAITAIAVAAATEAVQTALAQNPTGKKPQAGSKKLVEVGALDAPGMNEALTMDKAFAKVATYTIPDKDYAAIKSERESKAQASKKARADKSTDNKALAQELRAHGIIPNGEAWAYAKKNGVAKTVKKFGK